MGQTADAEVARRIVLAGGGAVCIGAIGPWANVNIVVSRLSIAGTDGDGRATLAVGALVALLALATATRPTFAVAFIASIVVIAIGLANIIALEDRAGAAYGEDLSDVPLKVGWGLIVTLVSAAALFVGGMLGLEAHDASTRAPRPAPKAPRTDPQPVAKVLGILGVLMVALVVIIFV